MQTEGLTFDSPTNHKGRGHDGWEDARTTLYIDKEWRGKREKAASKKKEEKKKKTESPKTDKRPAIPEDQTTTQQAP